jgi:hypothetical protein
MSLGVRRNELDGTPGSRHPPAEPITDSIDITDRALHPRYPRPMLPSVGESLRRRFTTNFESVAGAQGKPNRAFSMCKELLESPGGADPDPPVVLSMS